MSLVDCRSSEHPDAQEGVQHGPPSQRRPAKKEVTRATRATRVTTANAGYGGKILATGSCCTLPSDLYAVGTMHSITRECGGLNSYFSSRTTNWFQSPCSQQGQQQLGLWERRPLPTAIGRICTLYSPTIGPPGGPPGELGSGKRARPLAPVEH